MKEKNNQSIVCRSMYNSIHGRILPASASDSNRQGGHIYGSLGYYGGGGGVCQILSWP